MPYNYEPKGCRMEVRRQGLRWLWRLVDFLQFEITRGTEDTQRKAKSAAREAKNDHMRTVEEKIKARKAGLIQSLRQKPPPRKWKRQAIELQKCKDILRHAKSRNNQHPGAVRPPSGD